MKKVAGIFTEGQEPQLATENGKIITPTLDPMPESVPTATPGPVHELNCMAVVGDASRFDQLPPIHCRVVTEPGNHTYGHKQLWIWLASRCKICSRRDRYGNGTREIMHVQ